MQRGVVLKKAAWTVGLTLMGAPLVQAEVVESTRLIGFGEAKYAEDFKHFEYVNSQAPKGGNVTYSEVGTYDSFNRYGSRGVSVAGADNIYDSLFVASEDEIDSYYPLIAEKVRYEDDYSWMEVDLNPKAIFHDGRSITAEDVAFTFEKFKTQGVPQFKIYYKDVKSVKAVSKQTVRIEMEKPNREVLLALVQGLKVLPKHYWQDKDLSEPLNKPPIGSSAYQISDYQSGQSITYTRVKDYWAEQLPVNVGRNNFDTIRYDYYRDATVTLEAFKAGEYDFRQENVAKFWATLYQGKNFDSGFIKKEEITHEIPQAMQAFVFNTERPFFSDARVREALNYAMDFEWMNKTLFYNQYTRSRSYFQNTEYEAKGLPSDAEKQLLAPIKDQIPPRVFTLEYQPPVSDGSGRIRSNLRKAISLLKEAGWELKDKVMTNVKSGEPLAFELMIYSPTSERIAIPVQKNLKLIGVEMKIRTIDTTQYIKRLRDRDFDMVSHGYGANKYPSTNLLIGWNSNYIESSYNTAGVKDPAVDYLTEKIAENQENPQALLDYGRALDRVLQWNFYVIPQWHLSKFRIATWDKFERPAIRPKYGLGLDTWWVDVNKASKLPKKRQ
ncbi:antibiotic ABC transporter substrate-binding protein [Photobacterium jeanii]|uniref:Antibiotic ABC transporter substrate-binding protein n=1 Tax=Photobacterium jeanii TaxID=858640 RepID=A0A178K420_9GAMM|nr:extracellular solute-binding protein [Photobacterium jeanii]OAN11494.1 antibiotic ABC transporter substrate-binding protein [Photobacterium jeanii]PST91014.1 ABC transporter substrate-binding protein [Photobacterium jeanii]